MQLDSWTWPAVVGALFVTALATTLLVGGGRRRRVVVAGAAAAVVFVVAGLAVSCAGLLPSGTPGWVGLLLVPVAAGVGALAVAVATAGRSARRLWRVGTAAVAAVLAVLLAATTLNSWYAAYPTVASLAGPRTGRLLHRAVGEREPAGLYTGRSGLFDLALPGATSGFRARQSYVWLPPAYAAGDRRLPVLLMLPGTPGSPADWIAGGLAAHTATVYADQHRGVAPVLVFADENGSTDGDTECVDSPRGRAETYLTEDVPHDVSLSLALAHGVRWGVVGLSEGGECAAMLALRHPQLFGAFGDYGGLTSPSVGDAVEVARTTDELFAGSSAAYDEHDPLWLLAHDPPHVAAFFSAGSDDRSSRHAQQVLGALAQEAHLATHATLQPGGHHTFRVWSVAFAQDLPGLAAALGLPPAEDSTTGTVETVGAAGFEPATVRL